MITEEIGYISKTHGLKGQVVLRLNEYMFIDTEKIASIFLEINGSKVPYFIETIQTNNVGYIVKFDTINSIDDSKKLIAKKAFSLPEFIIEDEESLNEFVGYEILDEHHGNIGTIVAIDEKTENILITVAHPNGKEIILPFNDDFIEEIDDDLKTILFKAPQGLIEMYLG